MRAALINIGDRFGRWTVIAKAQSSPGGQRRWRCKCECGNERSVAAQYLRGAISQSCGCLMREQLGNRSRKHGGKGTPECNAWQAIIQRCTNPNHQAWSNYGGRGITVCSEWRHDFAAFLAHVGPRPSPRHSIDRIDNDRGYEPGNVRWATYDVQMKNRRPRPRDTEGRFA